MVWFAEWLLGHRHTDGRSTIWVWRLGIVKLRIRHNRDFWCMRLGRHGFIKVRQAAPWLKPRAEWQFPHWIWSTKTRILTLGRAQYVYRHARNRSEP